MEKQIKTFIDKKLHIIAFILFAIFLLANIIYFTTTECNGCEIEINKQTTQDITTLSKLDWQQLSKDYNNIIIDIRTPEEFKTQNIKNSININFYSQEFKTELNKLNKNKTYLIYCRSGSRSKKSLNTFKELNFTKVYDLQGGINTLK